MSEWIYFLHPPREDFAATMTPEEKAVWDVHFERLQGLLAEGVIVLAGQPAPTDGPRRRQPSRRRAGGEWRPSSWAARRGHPPLYPTRQPSIPPGPPATFP